MECVKLSVELGDSLLSLEVGKVAKQASGSCLASFGETVVLATCCVGAESKGVGDFVPLTVDYVEMTYAAGKIPGGFIKREGRPSEREILASRFIDRSIRPLIPKGFDRDIQIIALVLSSDLNYDSGMLAITAVSCALHVSEVPFDGPIAGLCVGFEDGCYGVNLVLSDAQVNGSKTKASKMDMIVAGTKEAILMVEGEMLELDEEEVLHGILFGHEKLMPIVELQDRVRAVVGKAKINLSSPVLSDEVKEQIKDAGAHRLDAALRIAEKKDRNDRLAEIREKLTEQFEDDVLKQRARSYIYELEKTMMRKMIVGEGVRIDGRDSETIRDIDIEVPYLPRTHGSALFTRGETQALVTATLGTWADEQKVDALNGEQYKKFMLHYNFLPFSVGEVKFLRSPSRREIGHGHLAERALSTVLPYDDTNFPYTIRIVSDILESNGSSSMATVCGGSLALMDAGVPVRSAVAGIAMGLVKEDKNIVILSDILGDEDHLGDMDFKVAGTEKGMTAFQMDVKIQGVDSDVLKRALVQAKEGLLHILSKMKEAIHAPRKDMSPHAPRIVMLQIKPEKIREVIGPGGKIIKQIVEKTKAKISIDDSGVVSIASSSKQACDNAIEIIQGIVREPEVGQVYHGKVKKVVDFGAFVEILKGYSGLVHISQISTQRIKNIHEVVKEGDEMLVKVIEIDRDRKIRLSHKDAQMNEPSL